VQLSIDTTKSLSLTDIKKLLSIIFDTLSVHEYPTSSMFSALSHCAIVSFLIGKDSSIDDVEAESVLIFRQLNDYAHDSNDCEWFVYWSKKLVDLVRERKLTKD